MHRVHFDGNDYFPEREVVRLLGCKTSDQFRDKFGSAFSFFLLSVIQRNQLVDAGLAPPSLRRSNGVLVLCEDVERYVESLSNENSTIREALGGIQNSSAENNSHSNDAIPQPSVPKTEMSSPNNDGNGEMLSVKLEPNEEAYTCTCQHENSNYQSKIIASEPIKGERKFVCRNCPLGYEFDTEEVYMRHMAMAHPNLAHKAGDKVKRIDSPSGNVSPECDDPLKCRICLLHFDSIENLQFHQTLTQHLYSLFKCQQCRTVCLSQPELDDHVKTAHPETSNTSEQVSPHCCIVEGCNAEFTYGVDLYLHVEKSHLNKVFICGTCFAMFRYKDGLIFHAKRTRHQIVRQTSDQDLFETVCFDEDMPKHASHVCPVCKKTFVFERTLLLHQRNCRQTNLTSSCLLRQFRDVGKKPSNIRLPVENAYSCPTCSWTGWNSKSFYLHKKSHVNGGLYIKCRHCDKMFRCHKTRLNHEKQFHQNTPAPKLVLIAKPKSDEDFVCKVCGQVFSTMSYLKDHEDSHAGIQRYECEKCKMRFSYRWSLARHMKKSCGDELLTWLCDICAKKFRDERCLKIHISLAHPGKNEEEYSNVGKTMTHFVL